MYTAHFIDTFLLSAVAFFATISPINVFIIFMSMTTKHTSLQRKEIAKNASIISFSILIIAMFFGIYIFKFLGVDMAAIRIAGGFLILITAMGMVFGEDKEAVNEDVLAKKKNIAVYPLAMPIIAGPAALTTSMLFITNYDGIILKLAVLLGLLVNLLLMVWLLLFSDKIMTKINKSILEVLLRLAGLILASLAMQFIIDGIKETGIFG